MPESHTGLLLAECPPALTIEVTEIIAQILEGFGKLINVFQPTRVH